VGLTDWLLALHLLAAAAMVGATLLFWFVVVVARRADRPDDVDAAARLLPFGSVAIAIGSLGTIGFGIWLAIERSDIEVWDGWVIAAIVLWAVASEAGRRADKAYGPAVARARDLVAAGALSTDPELRRLAHTRKGLILHSVASLLLLVILILMVWKPGA
jgi:uncharacterized membrane protein